MPQAFDECSSLRFGKTIDRVHEVYVRPASFQERDEMFAQRLVVISRFAFLFSDALVFFFYGSFLFFPRAAACVAVPEPDSSAYFIFRPFRTSFPFSILLAHLPSPFQPA